MYCIADAVCLYADDQESFDLGLPFFELIITFDISIVFKIDSYVQLTVSL